MVVETTGWKATDHIDSNAAILTYLKEAFKDGDPALIAAALAGVAKVGGIAEQVKPQLDIALDLVIRTLKALGFELTAKTA